jgi:hypothetical protein
MPINTYPWHIAKCPDRLRRIKEGLPIYQCEKHKLHLFLNRVDLMNHMKICNGQLEVVKFENTSQIKASAPVPDGFAVCK